MSACLSGSGLAYSLLSPLPSQQKTLFTASGLRYFCHATSPSPHLRYATPLSPHLAPCHDSTPSRVQIGSILGFVTLPLAGLYCATKYAVRSLTEAMGFELAPFGIQVHG